MNLPLMWIDIVRPPVPENLRNWILDPSLGAGRIQDPTARNTRGLCRGPERLAGVTERHKRQTAQTPLAWGGNFS